MGTHTGTTHPEQQRRIEIRAPKHEDEQKVVVREPGGPRGEGDSAPSQRPTASVPAREGSSDPISRPAILTEERHEPQAKASRPPPRGRVAILVMGGTGTGKSSFIAEVTGQRVKIGHDLHSCTEECTSYECPLDDQNVVTLVDTPGFNDTNRLDLDILKCISTYLTNLQQENIELAGIIYLQRITDRRMTGASFLNLQMFQAFCGEKYSPQVVFVTTMWNTIGDNNAAQQQLISREKELAATPKFWGDMITHGARVRQFHGDRASGLDIIHLLYQQEHGRKPRIMSEFDHGYILPDTAAGQVITAEIVRQQKRREKEEREEREEIEAEQSSRRRALSLNNSPREPQTAPRPHIQRRPPPPPPPPARGPQTEGAHRRQPNPAARQAAQFVYYSSWSVGPP